MKYKYSNLASFQFLYGGVVFLLMAGFGYSKGLNPLLVIIIFLIGAVFAWQYYLARTIGVVSIDNTHVRLSKLFPKSFELSEIKNIMDNGKEIIFSTSKGEFKFRKILMDKKDLKELINYLNNIKSKNN